MKILWVKAGGLVPADVGGRIRSYHILLELAKQHSVTFFTFYAEHPEDVHPQLANVFDRVVCLPLPIPLPRSQGELFHFVRYTFSRWPYSVAKHCRPEVAEALRKLLKSESYEVIVCDFVAAGGVIPWDHPCPKILFTHNVEAMIWKRHFQVSKNPLWKAISWREYRKMKELESSCLQQSDHVLAVSEADRAFLSECIPPEKITVIPTGVDISYFHPGPQEVRPAPNSLVFTGAMDWLPNEDAVLHFAREILPRIHAQEPTAVFTIVGRNPSTRVQALGSEAAGIRVTGRVQDVRPYVQEAAAYVVPLRVGSGTRLKIFEAMAMGKAIVSTRVGAEGLPVSDDKDILLADDPDSFATKVVALLRDERTRERLGDAARALVESRFSWHSAAKVFEDVLQVVARDSAVRQESHCLNASRSR